MIGQTISHYKILEKLGEGGMGVVYKAHDSKLGRDVAIKFLPRTVAGNAVERERFTIEAKAAAALNHPNIATVYAIEEVDDETFIVMEYVEGYELKEKIAHGALPIDEARRIASQVAEGLQAAHRKGIVHRDIKSANIMLTNDGQVKIMDFGLAKIRGGAQVTKVGTTVGTAAYMSPEQARGDEVDHRTDIWSLGVVLYEMLTGRLPFASDYEQAVVYSILNETPERPDSVRAEVRPDYADVAMRALAKDPGERYPSAEEMASALRSVQERQTAGENGQRRKRSLFAVPRRTVIVALAVLALVTAALFLLTREDQAVRSVAVLPFENVGGDQTVEYLSDGITESLINSLSTINELKVMSRSAVFRHKGTGEDPTAVGKELGVDAVLYGRINQRENMLTVGTELIKVSDDTHLWGTQYNRSVADLLAIQEEITREIISRLKVRLGDRTATAVGTRNNEAYQLYLKGRYFWNKRTADDMNRSIGYFNQAVEVDPSYALAYAGLSDAYMLLGVYSDALPAEAFPKAKAAAGKALAINPNLAEVHATLGDINIHYGWDWDAAGKELRKAIELDSTYATAYHWYAEYLTTIGRHNEAIVFSKKAGALDPLSAIIGSFLGWNYYMARQYDAAIIEYRKAIVLDPDFVWAHMWLAECYFQKGMTDEMIQEAELARGMYPHQLILSRLAYFYASVGRTAEAAGILARLTTLSRERFVTAYCFALIHLGLGNRNEIIRWLERAFEERAPQLYRISVDPTWDPVRSEPRFAAVLQKMGLGGETDK